MKKFLANLMFISTITITFLYAIISVAVEEMPLETEVTGAVAPTANAPEAKAFSRGSAPYDRIREFPIGKVFNTSVDFFCIQHNIPWGKSTFDTVLGANPAEWHVHYTIAKHRVSTFIDDGSDGGVVTADIDTSADYYIDENFVLHKSSKKYIGYHEAGETPTDTAYTNWVYKKETISFGCPNGCSDLGANEKEVKLAFLMAAYKAGGPDTTTSNGMDGINNTYRRGKYSSDPLQSAVWASWLNSGVHTSNQLAVQEQRYWEYHQASANPNVDVIPDTNVGTVLSGNTYVVGPFKMSAYVRAKNYVTGKIDTTEGEEPALGEGEEEVATGNPNDSYSHGQESLQDIFGTAADRQGTIIKAIAVVTNEGGALKEIEFPVPEPNATFYINLNAGDIAGYDELKEIRFVYQRIHAYANGTKYIGEQKLLTFSQKGASRDGSSSGSDRGCHTYKCTSCKHTGIEWSGRSAAGQTHIYWCLGSGYCANGNTQGTVYSDLKSGCSYSWACGKSEHSHGSGCNTSNCSHTHSSACCGVTTPGHVHGSGCDTSNCSHTHSSSCCSKEVHSHSLGSCGKTHTCSKNWCSHGHQNGKHDGTCKSWGSGHIHDCSATTVCEGNHNHQSCYQFTWDNNPTTADKCQDGYAGAGDFSNEIRRYDIIVKVPLKTNMKIYKYITDVKHNGSGGRNINVGDRSGDKSVQEKLANSVKLERGDTVTYTIKLKNASRFKTAVQVRDILPSACSRGYKFEKLVFVDSNAQKMEYTGLSGAKHTASWIEVPEKGEVVMTVKLDPLQYSGTFENKVEFITTNSGAIHMRFVLWGQGATHGPRGYANGNNTTNIVNEDESRLTDSDFYTIKEYDLTLDKYITEVKHETNNVVTYSGTERKQIDQEGTKKNDPIYAEYGDVVTYKIDIYNTKSPYLNAGSRDRNTSPFWDPDLAYVDITDTLPKKYSKLTVSVSNGSGSITTTNGGFKVDNIQVPYNGVTTVTVTIVVEEHVKGTLEENNARITPNIEVRNVNHKGIVNHSAKTTTSDWYKINDYKLTLDKYISDYKHELTDFNNSNTFTQETNTLADRYAMTEEQKKNAPMQAEKDETIIYSIRLTNDAVEAGKKKATQVRPTKIQDAMDKGLEYQSVVVNVYRADGSVKFANVPVTHTDIGNNTHTFEIGNKYGNDYLILDPTDYIIYDITVKVTKTNMYLYSLENTGSMIILTDINHETDSREVKNDIYNENIADQQVSKEYVKLKDLVIAGKVWLDRDKDGYIGQNANGNLEVGGNAINVEANPSTNIEDTTGKEYAMQGIIVRLYKADGTLLRTTKTDSNGLFTFGRKEDGATYYSGSYTASGSGVTESEQRIDKATNKDANKNYTELSEYISYYIEYEYDGLVYKSTEIYSDNKNIGAEGEIDDKYKRDSNAYEFTDVRENFNKHYEIVAFNKAYDGTLAEENALEYEKKNHESFIRVNKDRKITARSFINVPSTTSIDNTKLLWLLNITTKDNKPETEYLKYINLGLEEREDVDISVTQDVYELKTTINGEEMTYEYNQNNYTTKDGEVTPNNVNNLTENKKDIDKAQYTDESGNETDVSKAFNSERFITGYKDDTSEVAANRNLYEFEYYLEDYNYRISQYHIDTIRNYKGSPTRNYEQQVNTSGDSVILDNANGLVTGRESELNTEVTFRIKVTNNSITNDEPHKDNTDIKVYTGINEIVEYYDEDFVDIAYNADGSIKGFNIKTKDANGYLVDTEMKVLKAKAYMKGNVQKDVILSTTSVYNTPRTLDGYDTLFIRPAVENTSTNTLTGNPIKASEFMLAEGESMDILITFIVEKAAETPENVEMETILGIKENIAEISAYSTYYKDGDNYKSASLIDKDSNPHNFGEAYDGVSNVDSKEYIKYIEDDTFKTGILLKVPTPPTTPPPPPDEQEEERYQDNVQRTLTGFVWDDARSNTAADDKGIQYIGDGTYDTSVNAIAEARKNKAFDIESNGTVTSNKENNDFRVDGVKAELIEIIRMPDPTDSSVERVYEDTIFVNGETGDNASVMRMRTASDGTYKFKGYIPGEYIVRFTYGDKDEGESADSLTDSRLIFNGQDYKSTSYQTKEAVYAENATANGDKTPGDVKLEILEKEGNSDAKDDEIRRLEVIGYSETMNNEKNEILKGKNSSNKESLVDATWVSAETADFLVRTEKEIRKVTVLTYEEINKKITETITNSRFAIRNIDFGLQYRPELQVALKKYISNITVTTSDSNGANTAEPIVDAIFEEYYGVVRKTDIKTGSTSFITDAEGNIIEVDPTMTNDQIANKVGASISEAETQADGTYVVAIAGTKLNTDKSVGLQNVQYLPNEYEIKDDGSPEVELVDGKYLVKATQGFAYIVVDDNIMQGATIKIKYLFTGTNISEVDRVASNLSDLRLKENKEVSKYEKLGDSQHQYYDEVIYQVEPNGTKPSLYNENYSAAKTARNALFSEYYRYELGDNNTIKNDRLGRKILYRVKTKDLLVNGQIVQIPDIQKAPNEGNPHSGTNGYYGRYLGSTYYTGKINDAMEVIAEIKLDKILDYIDNDLVFNNDDNRGENGLWKTTTSNELYNDKMLNPQTFRYYDANGNIVVGSTNSMAHKLVDADGRAYDTPERSNLALSLDDRVRDDYANNEIDSTINKEFSKFLMPRESKALDSFGKISLTAAKVLSPEDETDDMVYENIAEIIQYTSVTGRVTNLATTIGNAKIEEITSESPEFHEGRTESDTASVEKVTLTPPTGLDRLNRVVRNVVEGASYTVVIVIAVAIVCVAVMVGVKIYHDKRRIK